MGCSSSKQGRSDYADAFLPPVPKPVGASCPSCQLSTRVQRRRALSGMQAPQLAPDLQPPRPVFNHKKTLSAHIREEAENKYGITGPLGNSMSVRGEAFWQPGQPL